MGAQDAAIRNADTGVGLLKNRLNESRSPYVSLLGYLDTWEGNKFALTLCPSGEKSHEKSSCMADLEPRESSFSQEAQPPTLRQYRLRCLSLYVHPIFAVLNFFSLISMPTVHRVPCHGTGVVLVL